MSKKGKKEETEVKQVNTDVDIENAYYNYDEPVVYETKKPGFFKKLFRGKKKVTSSSDLANEENFYGNFGGNEDYNNVNIEPQQVQQPPMQQQVQQVQQQPIQQQPFNKPQPAPPPIQNNNNNNYNDDFADDKYKMNYNYTQPFEDVEDNNSKPMSKTLGYGIGALLLVGVVIFGIIKIMSAATEKYYVNVGTTSISIRPYEGEQITFLTNDSKKTKFTSSDENVVTVNEYGYVSAKGYKETGDGYMKATITVGTASTNKQIDVYIVPTSVVVPMEDFTVPSDVEISLNSKMLIEISNITPPNNTRQKFDYISSDTNIADVSGIGIITGRKKGTTTIEVRNHINKNISKIINVTVK